jgi:YD repeat-containing protein
MGRSFVYSSLSRLTSATNPESGTIGYVYDANGNLVKKTDARSVITCFGTLNGSTCDNAGYDALNRVVKKSYSDGTPTVSYLYYLAGGGDFTGTLKSVGNSASTTTYTHDGFGRVATSTQKTPTSGGTSYQFTYGYTNSLTEQATSVTYPSGRSLSYSYDAADRPARAAGTAGSVTTNYIRLNNSIAYTAAGGVVSVPLGNNLTESYTWNDRLQLTAVTAGTLALNFYPCDGGLTACSNNNGNMFGTTHCRALIWTGTSRCRVPIRTQSARCMSGPARRSRRRRASRPRPSRSNQPCRGHPGLASLDAWGNASGTSSMVRGSRPMSSYDLFLRR